MQANQSKKTMIVLGKMGVGKSSFVKMLVKNPLAPKSSQSIQSATNQCSLYEVDPQLKLKSFPIYIIDTPGINSNQKTFSILEQLEKCIEKYQCQIIGIMYVIDIGNPRQLNDLFYLLKYLKLRLSIQKKVLNFIISKWDINYLYKQKNNKIFAQLKQLIDKQGFGEAWDRKIMWMSQPNQDKQVYQTIKQSDEGKKCWIKQWQTLKQNLGINSSYSFSDYQNDKYQFYSTIISNLNPENVEWTPKALPFKYFIYLNQEKLQLQRQKGTVTFAGTGLGIMSATAVTLTQIGQILLLGTTTEAFGLLVYKILKQKKRQVKQITHISQQQTYLEWHIKQSQLKSIKQSILFKQFQLQITDSKWVNKFLVKQNQSQLNLKQIQRNGIKYRCCRLEKGNLEIIFVVKTPTITALNELIRKETSKFYSEK